MIALADFSRISARAVDLAAQPSSCYLSNTAFAAMLAIEGEARSRRACGRVARDVASRSPARRTAIARPSGGR
jgi:hypothetical protein